MNEFDYECIVLHETGLKSSQLRKEYENRARELADLPQELENCYDEEQIARIMHEKRRELGRQYKEAAPPLFREYIFFATAQKYGDPLGPTFEMLRKVKTCREIIESASRPIADLDDRLTEDGFRTWYENIYRRCERKI